MNTSKGGCPQPIGSTWRDGKPELAPASGKEKRAGSRLMREQRKPSRPIIIPNYATGDAMTDALMASIAGDILKVIPL